MARPTLFVPAIPGFELPAGDGAGPPADDFTAFAPSASDLEIGLAAIGDDDSVGATHATSAALNLNLGLGLDLWGDGALSASRDALAIDLLRFTQEADDPVTGSPRSGALDDADARAGNALSAFQTAFASPDDRSVLAALPADAATNGDVVVDLGLGDAGLDAKAGGGGKPGGGGSGNGPGTVTNYFSGSTNPNPSVNPGANDPGYDIWIEFKGTGWTVDLQKAFKQAADYLTSVITNDIGGGGLYQGKVIDDLYVSASLATIDGTGGVLGQAGPSAAWSANQLTAAGQMQFDVADATNYLGKGLWDDIVTHELMHVLGFGTLWEYGNHNLNNKLVDGFNYVGPAGVAAYQESHPGETFIPIESGGGSGTAGGHWSEALLGNELMTGYINDDKDATTIGDNYLSKFSVMSLADLGYIVAFKDYPYDALAIA